MPDAGPIPCEEDGRTEVGTGQSRLLALPEEGGELEIVRGPQGGIHLLVGAWVRDLPLEMTLRYYLEAGERVGEETVLELSPSYFAADGARYRRHPDLLILDNLSADVEPFAGRIVRIHVEARTADDASCDVRSAMIVDPG